MARMVDAEALRAQVRERLALIESKREPEPKLHTPEWEDWAHDDFTSGCIVELCNWFLSILEPTEPT